MKNILKMLWKDKTEIIIIAGFLGSGKTTFIKNFYGDKNFKVIICEDGKEKIKDSLNVKDIDRLIKEINKIESKRIIVEFNGTWSLTEFIAEISKINDITSEINYIFDAEKIHQYLLNFPTLIFEQMNYADNIYYINNFRDQEMEIVKDAIYNLKPWIKIKKIRRC